MAKKPQTNVEFVTNMMEFSRFGALSQLFIIQAIDYYARLVSEADPTTIDTPLINGQAWVGVAREIKEKIENRK